MENRYCHINPFKCNPSPSTQRRMNSRPKVASHDRIASGMGAGLLGWSPLCWQTISHFKLPFQTTSQSTARIRLGTNGARAAKRLKPLCFSCRGINSRVKVGWMLPKFWGSNRNSNISSLSTKLHFLQLHRLHWDIKQNSEFRQHFILRTALALASLESSPLHSHIGHRPNHQQQAHSPVVPIKGEKSGLTPKAVL